jgi:hypothetical protein
MAKSGTRVVRELEQEAWGMARSGRYAGSRAIQAAFAGALPRSKRFFANPWVQQELDRICSARVTGWRQLSRRP